MTRSQDSGFRVCARTQGFTLIELLVSCVVLALVLGMLFSAISSTSEVWRRSRGSIEAFQAARNAYEILTRNLSQATLNTHWSYDNATNPTRYLRASDLHFVVGQAGDGVPGTSETGQAVFFQAPIGVVATDTLQGLNTVLNGMGYYIQFSGDAAFRPKIVTGPEKYRYRLMQMRTPSEQLDVYTATNPTDFSWFTSQTNRAFPVSDNVILLVAWPRLPALEEADGALTPDFRYNSRLGAEDPNPPRTAAQLPPVMEVLIIAIDETSATRLAGDSSAEPALIRDALQGKFQNASHDAIATDLAQIESALAGAKINYRVFRSAIPMRESKWSE